MPTYLLTWNPKRYLWGDFNSDYEEAHNNGYVNFKWTCGGTKRIKKGDRVFLLRQGVEPKGILAAGKTTSTVFEDELFDKRGKVALYVKVRFDNLLAITEILPRESLNIGHLKDVNWNTRASGMPIYPPADKELEILWQSHLDFFGKKSQPHSGEADKDKHTEGGSREVTMTVYERDLAARKKCLTYHGTTCCVCNFNFGKFYGNIAKEFIHVHHLKPLADSGKKRSVDPVDDLRPVCPNCHNVIHLHSPPYTIEEMVKILKIKQNR